MAIDRHHILHERTIWTANKTAKKLRQTHELIPEIDRHAHVDLHEASPIVPILGHHALMRIGHAFDVVPGDTLGSLDNLMLAVEKTIIRDTRVHWVERQLGGLVLASLETQKPYLVDGVIRPSDTAFVH